MRKILFMMPNLAGGGAEKVLVNLCNQLSKEDYNVTILLLYREGINLERLSEKVQLLYCFQRKIPGMRYICRFFSPQILSEFFIKGEYDLIISYLEGIVTRIASGYNGSAKKIAWIHSKITQTDIEQQYRNIKEYLMCYQTFDKIVTVSEDVRQNFLKITAGIDGADVTVLHNVNETDLIKSKSKEPLDLKLRNSQVHAIVVGKIAASKGVFRIYDEILKHKEEMKGLHINYIGDGPEFKEMQLKIIETGLQDNISLLGYQSNPYKYIATSDFLICPSYTEGLSTVVTEALILGVPVVATDCGGMRELLGDSEYGIVTENTDEALYEGIRKMVFSKTMREEYRKKSSERGKEFSMNYVVLETKKLFDIVLAE